MKLPAPVASRMNSSKLLQRDLKVCIREDGMCNEVHTIQLEIEHNHTTRQTLEQICNGSPNLAAN